MSKFRFESDSIAEDTASSDSNWDSVFFKVYLSAPTDCHRCPTLIYAQVEDRFFCVPRCEFVQSSEVFADMFHLPSGPAAHTEGQDRKHPIILEGYKKDEFSCLLKVMYPTYICA